MIFEFIPVVIFFTSMVIPTGIALLVRYQRRKRRSPLTLQLLRSPGQSITTQVEAVSEDVGFYFTYITMIPLLVYAMYLSVRYYGKQDVNPLLFWIILFPFICFFSYKLVSALKKRNSLQLGLDCERAVGQELDQLMLDGYRVYHDFPAENFNIDHIVIGANGVFAVETKGRGKPLKGDVKVLYDGEGLQFPTHYERDASNQAKRQAEWLSKHLSGAVGASVAVKPVLVYPGWYIERKKPGLLIYNGKNSRSIFKSVGESTLSEEMIQRIAHQVEQRCRDVDAVAFQKPKLKA